jgi:hypothetical protein
MEAAKPAPAIQSSPQAAPVIEAAKPAPVVEASKTAPVMEAANSVTTAAAPKSAAAATEQAPAAAPGIVTHPKLSPAAQREAALEAGVEPPPVDTPQAATTKASAPEAAAASSPAPVASTVPSVATAEKLYIRIGTFRSRTHARHVAARLRRHRLAGNLNPSDIHVARLTRQGRHWYRVWIRGVGDRPAVQDELASVHSLGYLHARIIVKLETERHLAQNGATMVASSSH